MSLLFKMLNANYFKSRTAIIMIIWLLYTLGSLSGIMFLFFLFMGSYTIVDFGLDDKTALWVDASLSIIFFLQHSIMVRQSFKKWIVGHIPDSYQAAFYAITSIIALILVLVFWQKSPVVVIKADGIIFWLLRCLFLLCLIGFWWGVKALGSFDALGVKSLLCSISNRAAPNQQIVAKGPYRWSRHPLYFFMLILIWSCPLITIDRLLFNVMWSLWIIIGTYLEDKDLHREFGNQYHEYSLKVPMLIPWRLLRNK